MIAVIAALIITAGRRAPPKAQAQTPTQPTAMPAWPLIPHSVPGSLAHCPSCMSTEPAGHCCLSDQSRLDWAGNTATTGCVLGYRVHPVHKCCHASTQERVGFSSTRQQQWENSIRYRLSLCWRPTAAFGQQLLSPTCANKQYQPYSQKPQAHLSKVTCLHRCAQETPQL